VGQRLKEGVEALPAAASIRDLNALVTVKCQTPKPMSGWCIAHDGNSEGIRL
jgi:hypothetical protein